MRRDWMQLVRRNLYNGWLRFCCQLVYQHIKDGEIDFDFMESFVAEMEAQRIAELSAYLKAGGYDNYEFRLTN